jgi:hypothetical protein
MARWTEEFSFFRFTTLRARGDVKQAPINVAAFDV